MMDSNFKVLIITFCGRSGSIFLQSLFDNHPNVINIPTAQLSVMYKPWENSQHLEKNYVLEIFDHFISVICNAQASVSSVPKSAKSIEHFALAEGYCPGASLGLDSLGEKGDICLKVDEDLFRMTLKKFLQHLSQISFIQFFEAFHKAYYTALKGPHQRLPKDLIIVFQLHAYISTALRMFYQELRESVFHIQMVRNPIAGIGSHLRMLEKSSPDGCASQLVFNDIRCGYNELPEFSNKSYSVRLEDLHADAEKSLRAICDWVGMQWSPALLESTFNGHKYWNVKDSDRVSGFNRVTTRKKYDDQFSKIDTLRLQILSAEKIVSWKYKTQWKGSGFFLSVYNLILFLLTAFFPYKFIQKMPAKGEKYYREHIHFTKKCFIFLVRRLLKMDQSKVIPLLLDVR